jgi:hypothetical protein
MAGIDVEERASALRARIAALVYPDQPLTPEVVDELRRQVLATGDPDLCAELVLAVHGREAVRRARELVNEFAERFPESERLRKLADIIRPPRIVPSPPLERIDRRPDFEWLKRHATEYRGEWLVLGHGRLWGHAPSLEQALEQARQAGLDQRPFVYRVTQPWEPDVTA